MLAIVLFHVTEGLHLHGGDAAGQSGDVLLGVSGIASGIVSRCRSNSAIQDRRRNGFALSLLPVPDFAEVQSEKIIKAFSLR
jgi:hypothetical protein